MNRHAHDYFSSGLRWASRSHDPEEETKRSDPIRRLLLIIPLCALVLLAASVFLITEEAANNDLLDKAWNDQIEFDHYADEMRQSSEDLTRMARNYVSTGDEKYLRYYELVRDIHQGDQPRPEDYYDSFAYWTSRISREARSGEIDRLQSVQDLTTDTMSATQESTQKSLFNIIKSDFKIDSRELSLLLDSEENLQTVLGIEHRAISTMQEGDVARANDLLYSQMYLDAKIAVIEPVLTAINSYNERSMESIVKLEERNQNLTRELIIIISILFFFVFVSFTLAFFIPKSERVSEEELEEVSEEEID